MLVEEFSNVIRSISYTTRKKRPDEVDGQDYFFIDQDEFQKRIQKGEFLEYAEVFGNYYGTSKKFVEEKRSLGKHVVLVIDTQGAMKLRDYEDAIFIFVRPPSMDEQRKRLQKRHTESSDAIEKRLSWAQDELQVAKDYDYQVINDDLKVAYEVLKSIIIAEEHRTCHFRQFSTKKG